MADLTSYAQYSAKADLAEYMRDVVKQVRRAVEVHGEPDQPYAATDLICNLLHYLREVHGIGAQEAIETVLSHHDAELRGEV